MRQIISAIIGILIVVVGYFGMQAIIDSKDNKRPTPKKVIKSVFVDKIINSPIPIVIPANGNLVAKRRVELYSEVQGIFRPGAKLFKPGQLYREGQAFISIDNSEYKASVQSAKSNLYNSIATIMADLRLDFPEVFPKWKTYLDGFNLNQPTPKLPEMTNEKENYFITGRGIVSSYYNVKNLEQRLTKYTISAPFNGILVEALVTEGKSFANLLKVGERVQLNNLEGTETYTGVVSRINGNIDAATQTVTAFIEVKNEKLKEGMYLEANLNAKSEPNAIEVSRSLLLDNEQIFVVKDSILDLIDVKPVYFSDTKVVLKNIPDGTVILSKPVPGSYAGMLVKPIKESEASNTVSADSIQ